MESRTMLADPTSMPRGVSGPFTSWRADGSLVSHGRYLDEGARSVPDGVWAFWYPSGRRRSLGTYRRGTPVGCFMLWDESGESVTGYPRGEELHVERCEPPDGSVIAEIERRGREPGEVVGDTTLHAIVGASSIGAREPHQIEPDPRLTVGFDLVPRRRFGPILLGPFAGIRLASSADYRAYVVGGTVAYTRALAPRLELDASVSMALDIVTVTARRGDLGTAGLRFFAPRPTVQVGIAYALSPMIQAVLAVRGDGLPARSEERDLGYCRDAGGPLLGCSTPQRETWSVGGVSVGGTLGIRLVLR